MHMYSASPAKWWDTKRDRMIQELLEWINGIEWDSSISSDPTVASERQCDWGLIT